MTGGILRLLLLLSTVIVHTHAGSCASKEPDDCLNRPRPGQRWACEDPRLQFPTVTCLARDILTCGKIKNNWCVFYSMGAKGFNAKNYASDDLHGRGVTFHDAFDDDYISSVIGQTRFRMTDPARNAMNLNRQNIYVRKLSQAFSAVCKGNAFVMIAQRNGRGGGVGAYQTPWVDPKKPRQDVQDNVWENDEFPSLQANDKIDQVFSVDLSKGNKRTVDWKKGQAKKSIRDVEAIPLPP